MTDTRPLYEPYRIILSRIDGLGPSPREYLGVGGINTRHVLNQMSALGYIVSLRLPSTVRRVYDLTELGRSVLESGVVEGKGRGHQVHRAFNTVLPPRATPSPRGDCIHWWLIETTPSQPATCKRCGARKVFRPRFDAEVVLVGGARAQEARYA